MSDTHRVTVPVDPTENMIEAGRRAGCIGSSVAGLVYDAMLSAAPAPEGGAVDDRLHGAISMLKSWVELIQLRKRGEAVAGNPIVDCVNDLPAIIRQLEAAELEIEGAFEAYEDAALATREEAPALENPDEPSAPENARDWPSEEAPVDTGEMEWAVDYNAVVAVSAYLQNQRLFDSAKAVERMLSRAAAYRNCRDTHAELAALRAQPPAREDAQPVAWTSQENMAILKGGRGAATMWPTNHGRSTPFALYTHPAPDALRVASLSRFSPTSTGNNVAMMQEDEEGLYVLRKQVFAALQAEQGD